MNQTQMTQMTKSILTLAFASLAGIAPAMTFSELQSAVNEAEEGATVYVTSDLEFDAPLTVAKRVTIASEVGAEPFVVRPAADYSKGGFLRLDSDSADITFVNIVFDGQRGDSNLNTEQLFTLSAGKVTLGNGAVIRNRRCPSYPAVLVTDKGEFVMEEGSVIREISSENYGIAVKTGAHGNNAADGTFRMNGGLITACEGHHKQTEAPMAWDGVVYLYGGTVYAHGGTICGNTSDYSTAGVCNYYGNLYISGSFTATNNVGGGANDVCRCSDKKDGNAIMIDGDYTGHMTLKLFVDGVNEKTPAAGVTPRYIYTSASGAARLGCENIVSEDDPTLALDLSGAYIVGGWYPKWRKIVAKIVGKTNKFAFLDALDTAESGDTILMCQDYTYNWTKRVFDKDLTIASDVGGPYRIFKRGVNYVFANVTESTMTFRDVILDGSFVTNIYNNGIVEAATNGTIVLDRGAVIRNCVTASSSAAVSLHDNPGARLVMKDGSVISNCYCSGNGYGVVVGIGRGNAATPELAANPPEFDMQGGLITGCTVNGTSTPAAAYCGVVYVWSQNATFRMSGGAITGNVSKAGCPGVVNYTGTVRLSGSAVIADNEGPYPGLYNYGARKTYYAGDFRGRVEVSNSATGQNDDQAAGKTFKVEPEDASATGAWCFRAGRSATELVGKWNGESLVWAEPVGSVGGVSAAMTDDLARLIPASLDLHADSADRMRLPIVLAGAATTLGGTVALSFDATHKKGQPASTLPLFATDDGTALTGEWAFTLPAEADVRRWEVVVRDDVCALCYTPMGMCLILR